MRSAFIVCLFLLFFTSIPGIMAQDLLPQDSVYLARFHRELLTTDGQRQKIDSIYIRYAAEIRNIESEMKYIQQSDMPEDSISKKITELNEMKKLKKDLRELDMTVLLTDDQKKIFNERIKPSKPQVLHFGINHDRASCVICK